MASRKRKPLITGVTRARERAIQDRLRARLSSAFEKEWSREIWRTMQAYAREAAGSKDYGKVQLEHERKVRILVEREWRAGFAVFGKRVLDGARKYMPRDLQTKAALPVPRVDAYDKNVADWIRTFGSVKVTEIAGTTQTQAMSIINAANAAGVTAGENEVGISKAIMSAMRQEGATISQLRARVIARTEAHTASSASTHEAARALEFPTKKEWLASGDERTRPSHKAADGQTVTLDAPFVVEGENLQYPGDPTGSAENVINCRCCEGIVAA
jgi:uncharacterized protein with gpF-like domain